MAGTKARPARVKKNRMPTASPICRPETDRRWARPELRIATRAGLGTAVWLPVTKATATPAVAGAGIAPRNRPPVTGRRPGKLRPGRGRHGAEPPKDPA